MIPQVIFIRLSRLRIAMMYSHESQSDRLETMVEPCRREEFCNIAVR